MPPKLKSPGAAPTPRTRGASTWIVLIGIGAALAALISLITTSAEDSSERPPAAAPDPVKPVADDAPPEAKALLGGLRPGDAIGAWKVHLIRLLDRQIGVDLMLGDKVATVWIVKKGSRPQKPPRETERYALYFGFPTESHEVAARDAEAILTDVENRLRKTEATLPAPPGM